MINKKKSILILSSTIILSFVLIVGIMTDNKKTSAESTVMPNEASHTSSLLSPELAKEYNDQVLIDVATKPLESLVTAQGEFYYVEFPNEYPSNQVANYDVGEYVTPETKQFIRKGFYYEKK